MGDNVVINVTENVTEVTVVQGDPFDARYLDMSNLPFYGDYVDGDRLVVKRYSDGLNYYLRPGDIRGYLSEFFPLFLTPPNSGDILAWDESDQEWYPFDPHQAFVPTYGWSLNPDAWTRVSDFVFTVNNNLSSYPQWRVGSKVRFYNPSVYKHGVIGAITYGATTTVTLVTNTDYVMAESPTTTLNSYIERPAYIPDQFNWNPSFSYLGGTTNPTFAAASSATWKNTRNRFTFDISALIQTGGVGDRDTTMIGLPDPIETNGYKPASVVVSGLIGTGDHVVPAYFDDNVLYVRHGTMTMDGAIFATGSFDV